MTQPQHHLDDATLASYASGALGLPLGVAVATHMRLCAVCRERMRQADAIGGELMRQQEPAPLSLSAREAMLSRLDSEPVDVTEQPVAQGSEERPSGPRTPVDQLPPELHPYFGDSYRALRWRMLVPGVHRVRSRIPAGKGDLFLLRIASGKKMPVHSHAGSELTVVLKGAYRDVLGRFGPGDVADLDSEVEHQPVTEPGEACICLAALDAPLRFPGRLARMLQPLFGI